MIASVFCYYPRMCGVRYDKMIQQHTLVNSRTWFHSRMRTSTGIDYNHTFSYIYPDMNQYTSHERTW